ncbi:MAG: hypothetical protein L0K86_02095 [Actinomycetia bacterium]|nr:hypothetical protein [Actinomycetes bacterium]
MAVKPKKKCCTSKPKCKRCPLRMLSEGTLPEGYTVKKRKLVQVDGTKKKKKKKSKTPAVA